MPDPATHSVEREFSIALQFRYADKGRILRPEVEERAKRFTQEYHDLCCKHKMELFSEGEPVNLSSWDPAQPRGLWCAYNNEVEFWPTKDEMVPEGREETSD